MSVRKAVGPLAVSVLLAAPAFAAGPYCNTPNAPIPDNNVAGVTVTQSVVDTQVLTDLNVQVIGSHTWVGDLIFTLTHGATSVTFIDRPGVPASGAGCSANDFSVILDDEAGTPVENMCNATPPALSGSATPNNPLTAFDGQSVAGTWSLNVSDRAGADTGTLTTWCLISTPVPVELMGFTVK
jgi:subtilisin-like proprotein convertase family protein